MIPGSKDRVFFLFLLLIQQYRCAGFANNIYGNA